MNRLFLSLTLVAISAAAAEKPILCRGHYHSEAEAIKPGDLVVRPLSLEGEKALPESTAALTQGGRITLRLHEWRDGQAIVMHPHIGLIRLSPAALTSLQFK